MIKCCKGCIKVLFKTHSVREYSKDSAMSLLRGWKKNNKVEKVLPRAQKFDYFLILDFEATCDNQSMLPAQEIIEFPVLKMCSKSWEVESTFHEYVKPVVCPQLSSFCTELTGIVQGQLEEQPHFPEVLKMFDDWMKREGLLDGTHTSAFVISGDWDMQTMLPSQCKLSDLPVPPYMRSWINVKQPFSAVMGLFPKGLKTMLQMLDLQFMGRLHSGIDDSLNIAQVLKTLALKDYVFNLTGALK